MYALVTETAVVVKGAAVVAEAAGLAAEVAGLAVSPPPIAVEGFDLSMLWHARTETDPAHRWFRQLVRKAGLSPSTNAEAQPIDSCQDRT